MAIGTVHASSRARLGVDLGSRAECLKGMQSQRPDVGFEDVSDSHGCADRPFRAAEVEAPRPLTLPSAGISECDVFAKIRMPLPRARCNGLGQISRQAIPSIPKAENAARGRGSQQGHSILSPQVQEAP